jgi:hypothetical protein
MLNVILLRLPLVRLRPRPRLIVLARKKSKQKEIPHRSSEREVNSELLIRLSKVFQHVRDIYRRARINCFTVALPANHFNSIKW